MERELEAVTAERQRLVREIEDRDAQFKVELAEYRRAVVGLASSPSPQRRALSNGMPTATAWAHSRFFKS